MLGLAAPAGTVVNHTLCGATLSWSSKVIVLFTPTHTVIADGWKFSVIVSPTPCGMTTVTAPEAEVVDVVEVVVVVLVVEVVLVVGMLLVVLVVEVLEPGTKMKYAAPAMSITTITAAATAPAPIPLLFCSNFIPSNSPKGGRRRCSFKRLWTPRSVDCYCTSQRNSA